LQPLSYPMAYFRCMEPRLSSNRCVLEMDMLTPSTQITGKPPIPGCIEGRWQEWEQKPALFIDKPR